MWNLTRTHQLALLLLLCTAIGPSLLTRATFAQPLLDDFSEESWGVLSERTHEAPSLTCSYPHPGVLPAKPLLPLPYCSHLSESSCCKTTGSTHVVRSFLDSFSSSFSINSGQSAEYENCRSAFETFACGRYCAPQQALYLDELEKSYAICRPFCQDLYSACRDVLDASTGQTIASRYTTSKRFCEAQTFNNYSIVVNPSDLCFKGSNSDASASHSHVSGIGYWLSEESRSGVPSVEYCFDVQLEDFYENPKLIGGDSVVVTVTDTAAPEAAQLLVTDNSDGSYSTCFISTTSTTYNFEYSINENDAISFTVAFANESWCPLKTPEGYTPRPASDLAEPCGGSSSDASCCPEFATGSCCSAAETANIKEYVTEELTSVFGGFPECLAKQQKLLCGLSCDPRQSEYVVLDGESLGNQTATFYICDSYCEALYDACGESVIEESEGIPISIFYDTADAFCQSLVPSYLSGVSFAVSPDSGPQTCFSGFAPPDACQSSVSDYDNTFAGEQGSFKINSRSVYGAALTHSEGYTWTVSLTNAAGVVVEGNLTDYDNGTFGVSYLATVSGYYTAEIHLVRSGQAPVRFCQPLELYVFPGPPSPANFLVYGDGLSGGYQDLPAYFTIQVRDQYGNNITDGGESFSFDFIRVRTGDQVHNISYIDNFDGTYSVSYVAPLPGAYNLTIYSGDEELVGRYSILILPVDAWRAFGSGLFFATAGETANFTLQHYNRLTNQNITKPRTPSFEFDFLFRGPGNVTVEDVVDNEDGTYTVFWSTTVAGRYRLDINERESEIVVSNSPFFPLVSPNVFDPAYSTATGDLEDLSACDSTNALVVITARDRYGNPTGLAGLVFNARFSGPEASVVSLTDNDDGTYSLVYYPTLYGTVNLSISYNETEILGSPFTINIKVGDFIFSPSNSTFYGSGLSPNPVCTAVREFDIQTTDKCETLLPEGGLAFNVTIRVTTSGGATFDVASEVVDNRNGTYRVSYYPTVSGTYTFYVADLAGSHLAGSPYAAGLFPPGASNALLTTASGLGLRLGSPSRANTFYISARDSCGNNQLSLLDEFVLGFEQKNITFSPDWYAYAVSNASYPYRVDYYAAADDEVHMSVRLVGDAYRHINGSPFTVLFTGVPCKPDCGGYGVCISGLCKCKEGYSGASCNATVPPPGLQGIRWNNLGAFVYVIFDAPTDRAITAMGGLRRGVPNRPDNFDCDVLLQFSTFTVYQLGLDYYCYWESDRVLVAVTGRGEMLTTGEVITIKNNTVRAKWGASDYSNGLSGVLQPPNYPQSPVNSIEAPLFVPSCVADVSLDSGASFGTAGNYFVSSAWIANDETQATGADSLQLSASQFSASNPLSVSFSSTNVHDRSGSVDTQLLRVEADIPEVRILGSPYVHTTPDKPVYLKGQATTPCGEQFADPLSYSWVIMEVPESAPLMQLDSVLSSTPQLYIPAGTLSALGTYTLRFSVSRNDTLGSPYESYAVAYVVVQAWSVNALIAPGDRQISRLSKLLLDASASLRPGQIADNMHYTWSCHPEDDPEAACMNDELLREYLGTSSPKVEISSSTLNPGAYIFNVSLTQNAFTITRRRSPNLGELTQDDFPTQWRIVKVTVVHHLVPVVHIEPIALGEVNAGDVFVLTGSAESRMDITSYEWSVDPMFDSDFDNLILTNRSSPRLVVKAGALAPGIRYKFKLSATNRDGTGWNTLDLLVNQPPLSGDFEAQLVADNQELPYVHVSFNAPFWEDMALDQPYGYQWFFTTQRGYIPLVVERAGKRSLPAAYFPRGFSNNIQGLVVRVADGRGGSYERRAPAPGVVPFSSSVCLSGVDQACQIQLVQNLMDNELQSARSRKDLDAILQLYNAIYDLVNQQLETSDSSIAAQRREMRQQLYDTLASSFTAPDTPSGTAVKVYLLLGLTEVPDEVTVSLANDVLEQMLLLVGKADSNTLGTMTQILSNLLSASESTGFFSVLTRSTSTKREVFAELFDAVLSGVAGGLVRSAVPGQQAAEKETTKSSFEMLNIPTPATDGSVYLKSSRVPVDDLPSSQYYGGITVKLPQALATALSEQQVDVVDVSFAVLGVGYSATNTSLRLNSGVAGLSIKHKGLLVQANNLSEPISVFIPLVLNSSVVGQKIGKSLFAPSPSVVCVAWKDGDWTSAGCTRGDNGSDAPTYSITECRCSFLSTAYATLYEWPSPFVPPVVAPEPSPVVAPTNGAPSDSDDPFMETDQIVLLVIFVVVCLVVALVLAKRTHYNHKKQFLAATSERELALWNKERGNDLYHVPHQPDPAPRPTEPAAERQPTTSRRSDKYSSQEQSDDNTPARQYSDSDSDDSRRSGSSRERNRRLTRTASQRRRSRSRDRQSRSGSEDSYRSHSSRRGGSRSPSSDSRRGSRSPSYLSSREISLERRDRSGTPSSRGDSRSRERSPSPRGESDRYRSYSSSRASSRSRSRSRSRSDSRSRESSRDR